MMERDLRMLTLFKQHYLNVYETPLKCQYSCWGYYDGISIEEVKFEKSKLYIKRTKSPISELWYGSMRRVAQLEGLHGKQNIGLFRCVDGNRRGYGMRFWKTHEKIPFFAVCFVQLKDRKDYENLSESIEERYKDDEGDDLELKYGAITYCTFDNADLVILIHSNSIEKLETIIWEIEKEDNIVYCHSIMGVSEKYLKNVADLLEKNGTWDADDCFGRDKISRITMKIVTSGDPSVLSEIRSELPKFKDVTYSVVSGHENLKIDIKDENVKGLLTLMMPGGFATHQNPLYGQGVYNIETSICREEKDIRHIQPRKVKIPKKEVTVWCSSKIKKYREKLDVCFESGAESLYSYYTAMIQTLNTLAQYEMFNLSNDIFYLLFPAFELFDQQLDMALENVQDMGRIKESICEYLDFVNSVIYHTVHTDQVFLMIPGYTGTTFAIPIKLCLFYSWFIKEIIEVINDSEEGYRYECLLIPVMESKPQTSLISMGLPHGDRLIGVKLSQRSLYMPRDLMIILAHEVAHYVGDKIRHRRERLDKIIKSIACVLSEGIIPSSLENGNDSAIIHQFEMVNKEEIQKFLVTKLSNCLKESCSESGYHASKIERELIWRCEEQLTDDKNGIYQKIYGISVAIAENLKQKGENYVKNMREIEELQRQFDNNRKHILASGVIREIISSLIKMYREVFSDIVAVALLDFSEELYEEAFRISEGTYYEEGKLNLESQVRENLIKYVRGGIKPAGVSKRPSSEKSYEECDRLIDELYAFNSTIDLLKEYAEICYRDTKNLIEKHADKVNEIKYLFQLFQGTEKYSCKEIYDSVTEGISNYNQTVKKLYEDAKRTII